MSLKHFAFMSLFILSLAGCGENTEAETGVFGILAEVVPAGRAGMIAAASTRNFYDNDFGRRFVKLFAERIEIYDEVQDLLEEGYHVSCIYIPEVPGSETVSFLYIEKCAGLGELNAILERCDFACEWVGTAERPVLKLSGNAFFTLISPNVFLLTQNEVDPVREYFAIAGKGLGLPVEQMRTLGNIMKKSFFYADLAGRDLLAELRIDKGRTFTGYVTLLNRSQEFLQSAPSGKALLVNTISEKDASAGKALDKGLEFTINDDAFRADIELPIDFFERAHPIIFGENRVQVE